jgi:hypothetical protein
MMKEVSYGSAISPSTPITYNNELHQDIVQTEWQSPIKIGAQIDAMLLSLQAIERIGYRMPDFSFLKI